MKTVVDLLQQDFLVEWGSWVLVKFAAFWSYPTDLPDCCDSSLKTANVAYKHIKNTIN